MAGTGSGNFPLENSHMHFRLYRNFEVLSRPRRFSTPRRGRFESAIGCSVSKTRRFPRALSRLGLAYVGSWRHPARGALGATGEELQPLPDGRGHLARAPLRVSARHAGCPRLGGAEIAGSLTAHRRALPHGSHRLPALPPSSLTGDNVQHRLRGLTSPTDLFLRVFDPNGKAKPRQSSSLRRQQQSRTGDAQQPGGWGCSLQSPDPLLRWTRACGELSPHPPPPHKATSQLLSRSSSVPLRGLGVDKQ